MKKHLSQKNIFLSIIAVMVALIFSKFFTLLSFPQSEIVLEKGEMMKIQNKETIAQKFTANRDGLMRVQILLRSPGIEKGSKMKMGLANENCQQSIFEGFLKDAFLESNNLYEFSFPKINDSDGKTYCLLLTLDSAKGKYARIFTTDKKYFPFPAENIYTGEKIGENSLSIRPVYKNSNAWKDLEELNKRISQYKPWFLKHYFLWVIAILAVILSTSLVISLVLM